MPQREGTEIESARLLADEAREELERDGLSQDMIRQAADAYITVGNHGDVARFIEHVRTQWRGSEQSKRPTPDRANGTPSEVDTDRS